MSDTKEQLHYDEKIEQEVFKEILDALTFIDAKFISREEYEKLNGNILVEYSEEEQEEFRNKEDENGKKVFRKDFELFLPKGITNDDKIKIYNILKNKFSEELYKQIFNEEKLPDILEIKNYLSNLTQKEKLDFKRDYITLARKSKNGQNISEILDEEIDFHFEELFFRQGVNNLRFGLNIMTQSEQVLLIENGNKVSIHSNTEDLENNEKLLRDKIEVEKYKIELDEVRKIGNKEKIAEIELKATNSIIKELYNNFPYTLSKKQYGDKPSKIQQTKELFCVGYSTVGHVFLEELGIKHKGTQIKSHSVLEVNIGGDNYLFDATSKLGLIKFDFKKNKGFYKKIDFKTDSIFKNIWVNVINIDNNQIKSGDVSKIIRYYQAKKPQLIKSWDFFYISGNKISHQNKLKIAEKVSFSCFLKVQI
ncbi:MAG: hypothetical protein Q9M94_02515 [Candidatus Gracilibacteria bacterium]|nr:hypothetical protein [Candidatus Gracilibacteria bacterium]MDQ7023518.1 hypothetical protein [Candidatus Gracilibacteria bacterium]